MTTESDNTTGANGNGDEASAAQDEADEPSRNGADHEAADATQGDAEADASVRELAELTAERDKLKDQLLRTAADFDNFRKRARREVEEAKMRGKDDAVRDFLAIFDNLERAVAACDTTQDVASVIEGVRMVLKLFHDTAERMGLNRIATVGERFDPSVHEAIQQEESSEQAPGTILREVVPGYAFGQRLLRAAMVVVARAPSKAPAAPSEPAAEPGEEAADAAAVEQPAADEEHRTEGS